MSSCASEQRCKLALKEFYMLSFPTSSVFLFNCFLQKVRFIVGNSESRAITNRKMRPRLSICRVRSKWRLKGTRSNVKVTGFDEYLLRSWVLDELNKAIKPITKDMYSLRKTLYEEKREILNRVSLLEDDVRNVTSIVTSDRFGNNPKRWMSRSSIDPSNASSVDNIAEISQSLSPVMIDVRRLELHLQQKSTKSVEDLTQQSDHTKFNRVKSQSHINGVKQRQNLSEIMNQAKRRSWQSSQSMDAGLDLIPSEKNDSPIMEIRNRHATDNAAMDKNNSEKPLVKKEGLSCRRVLISSNQSVIDQESKENEDPTVISANRQTMEDFIDDSFTRNRVNQDIELLSSYKNSIDGVESFSIEPKSGILIEADATLAQDLLDEIEAVYAKLQVVVRRGGLDSIDVVKMKTNPKGEDTKKPNQNEIPQDVERSGTILLEEIKSTVPVKRIVHDLEKKNQTLSETQKIEISEKEVDKKSTCVTNPNLENMKRLGNNGRLAYDLRQVLDEKKFNSQHKRIVYNLEKKNQTLNETQKIEISEKEVDEKSTCVTKPNLENMKRIGNNERLDYDLRQVLDEKKLNSQLKRIVYDLEKKNQTLNETQKIEISEKEVDEKSTCVTKPNLENTKRLENNGRLAYDLRQVLDEKKLNSPLKRRVYYVEKENQYSKEKQMIIEKKFNEKSADLAKMTVKNISRLKRRGDSNNDLRKLLEEKRFRKKLLLEKGLNVNIENSKESILSIGNALQYKQDSALPQKKAPVGRFEGYLNLLENFKKVEEDLAEFLMDKSLKNIRADCQKTINLTLNTISAQCASHLLDKYEKLSKFLNNETVIISEKPITASRHPLGALYSLSYLAKKTVKQGELCVSYSPEAAFAIASVVVALWTDMPQYGKLLLSQFYQASPYLIPTYRERRHAESEEQYNKRLGFLYPNNEKEDLDRFLKRQSGIMRLYCAIIVTPHKTSNTPKPHPLPLMEGWQWLTTFLKLPPKPDISATVLLDMLEVTGHMMASTYKLQFWKIMDSINDKFLPLIEQVTPAGRMGPVSRLRAFLESALAGKTIPPPKGLLPPDFW